MPQEFQVLRCFSCETFQVQIVKKKGVKWECKLCNIKQSIKYIYGKSFSAKECRVQVQKLNVKRRDISDLECDKIFAQRLEKDHDLYHKSFGNNKVPPEKEHSKFFDNLRENEIPEILWNKNTVKVVTSTNIDTSQPCKTSWNGQNHTKDNNKQKLSSPKWSKYLVVDKDDSD